MTARHGYLAARLSTAPFAAGQAGMQTLGKRGRHGGCSFELQTRRVKALRRLRTGGARWRGGSRQGIVGKR